MREYVIDGIRIGNFTLIESVFVSDDLDMHRVTIGYFLK